MSDSPTPEAVVLVVDDDPAYVRLLSAGLEAQGYAVVIARTGSQALAAADRHTPDVTILDLGLPDVDGMQVCRHLRRASRNPILVVTADGGEQRKVEALSEGADDYVTKPFSLPELFARVRVALRHRRLLAPVVDDGLLQFGALTMDTEAHGISVRGRPVELAAKEYTVLEILLRNAGSVLTHRQLLDYGWEGDSSTGALRTQVAKLRKKLGPGPEVPAIEGLPGVGYRLHLPE